MNNYKMLALDMDGTTLNTDGLLSDENKKYIKLAYDKGIKIVLISGRDIETLEKFSLELGIDGYISGMNGNVVYSTAAKKVVSKYTINSDDFVKLLNISIDKKIYMASFIENDVYVNIKGHKYYDLLQKFSNRKVIEDSDIFIYFKDNKLLSSVIKIAFIGEYEDLLSFQKENLETMNNTLSQVFSLPFFLELYRNDRNKGQALKEIADFYNIKSEEIIAIGDGENDIEMLKFAGYSICPENAMEKVKKAVNLVSVSNNKNVVAKSIKEFLL